MDVEFNQILDSFLKIRIFTLAFMNEIGRGFFAFVFTIFAIKKNSSPFILQLTYDSPKPNPWFFYSDFVILSASVSIQTISRNSVCSLILIQWVHVGPQRSCLSSIRTWVLPFHCTHVCLCWGSAALVPAPLRHL